MKIQKSKLITESIWVSIAEYMMLASIFLVNIVLNRKYGTEVLGKFSVAYSISQIIIFGLGTGFSPLIRRELTLNQDNKEELVNNVLHLRMLLLLFVCFLSIVLGSFFFKDRSLYLIFIIFLFSRGFDLISDTFYVFYQSVDRIETYSYLKISHSIFLIISIFILAYLGFSEKYIYLVFLFVSAIFLIINVLLIRLRKELNLTLKGLLILTKNKIILLNDVLPLILNSIIFQLKSRSSVLIVFVFLGTIATGTYSSVLMTITIFTAASSPLGIVLFPKLNKAFSKSSKDVIIQMQKIILTLLFVGAFFTLIHYCTISIQINLIGKLPDYANEMFEIMSLSIPFLIAIGGVGNIFVIINRLKESVYYNIFSFILTIVLYYLLIQVMEIKGIAITYLLTGIINLLLMYFYTIYLLKKEKR